MTCREKYVNYGLQWWRGPIFTTELVRGDNRIVMANNKRDKFEAQKAEIVAVSGNAHIELRNLDLEPLEENTAVPEQLWDRCCDFPNRALAL